ncbi:sensor histidine kinase [Terrimonas pollutisoli]|uniref:sensor histidine kinase n=1 Tax=Terrimonas pollutisoli TaxID=3034147 RepID=UPI0023EAA164|nr:HAMP domain-containing sensor histidine kinase [Terrimonas sp. H1YJ31]
MRYFLQVLQPSHDYFKTSLVRLAEFFNLVAEILQSILHTIKNIGVTAEMSQYEKSRLGIFNSLNFFQLISGFVVPLLGIFSAGKIPLTGWLVACIPPLVSSLVLFLNNKNRYNEALVVYFTLYPLFTCFSYINGINFGIELSFILYGILAVFFIRDIGYMFFSISFSMISYFILSVVLTKYRYQLEDINFIGYLFNQALALIYIFYGLYLIKKENADYQASMMINNSILQQNNQEIQKQAEELDQLNSLKNKLFSVISHDLKAPMYALRNLFDDMQKQDMPADEIKELIPDVKNDLNYTVSLMDNLLQWAKSQMQADTVNAGPINVKQMIDDVLHILYLQAEAKKIHIENRAIDGFSAWADRDMISLVLRNLISNAIKFSPSGGHIYIGTFEQASVTEVYVKDAGKGISQEEMKKIASQDFYTSNGTAQEQGTGLGLMLCKEFLAKNNGHLRIQSEIGKGSIFSFTLPRQEL